MNALLNRLKISKKIGLALALPVLGLLAFSGFAVFDQYRTENEMATLQRIAGLAPDIGALVHELQKERGLSEGFIGSKGAAKFRTKVNAQRINTDKANKSLADSLLSFDAAAFGPGFVQLVKDAQRPLASLPGSRTKINDLSFTVPDVAGYYSGTIAKLLNIIGSMASLSSNADLANSIVAYISFLQAKERSGQERAIGAGGIASGQMPSALLQKFIGLIGQQKAFLDTFNAYATENLKAAAKGANETPVALAVEDMRKAAIGSAFGQPLGDLTGVKWVETITNKINDYKLVEDKVSAFVVGLSSQIQQAAWQGLLIISGLTFVLFLIAVPLVYVTVRSITGSISSMIQTMLHLSEGNNSIEIDGTDRQNEIGDMARTVLIFKDNAIETERLTKLQDEERAAKEERAKVVEAMVVEFDTSSSALLEKVANASTQLAGTAVSMSGTAQDTSTFNHGGIFSRRAF